MSAKTEPVYPITTKKSLVQAVYNNLDAYRVTASQYRTGLHLSFSGTYFQLSDEMTTYFHSMNIPHEQVGNETRYDAKQMFRILTRQDKISALLQDPELPDSDTERAGLV